MVLQWTFGDRVRKIRRAADMTVEEFARELDVNKSTMAHYETDRKRPRDIVAFAKRVQLRFGVRAEWTLGLNENAPSPDGDGAEDSSLVSESNRRPFHYE